MSVERKGIGKEMEREKKEGRSRIRAWETKEICKREEE